MRFVILLSRGRPTAAGVLFAASGFTNSTSVTGTNSPFFENYRNRSYDHDKTHKIIPLQRFAKIED
jgi:hypothetical protein